MSVRTNVSDDGKILSILVDGKFNFSILSEFRNAYTGDYGAIKDYVVDLRGTDSMDSSALGMLLNMKKHVDKNDNDIKIVNCKPVVKKILMIARFDKKFNIE
ncbi:MAG: STAS domain-containing protein [Gammaproteobacteria bacterium]|nr:STAS domain-containing protein [Gammaproteobacteria bacterium]MDH5799333.1 STAS domain-containing protein [Gammaproteobacteria bacterium]